MLGVVSLENHQTIRHGTLVSFFKTTKKNQPTNPQTPNAQNPQAALRSLLVFSPPKAILVHIGEAGPPGRPRGIGPARGSGREVSGVGFGKTVGSDHGKWIYGNFGNREKKESLQENGSGKGLKGRQRETNTSACDHKLLILPALRVYDPLS